jgi:hypothetical protein
LIKPKQSESPAPEPKAKEMTLAESRAYRASLHKPQAPILTEEQKREEFRKFWASNKKKYGEAKNLEKALWLHLKTIKMDSPEDFKRGCDHFGLKVK